jgi:uncharacterized membrane protein
MSMCTQTLSLGKNTLIELHIKLTQQVMLVSELQNTYHLIYFQIVKPTFP